MGRVIGISVGVWMDKGLPITEVFDGVKRKSRFMGGLPRPLIIDWPEVKLGESPLSKAFFR